MINLNLLLSNRLSSKTLVRVIAIVALIGFADTAYLTFDHYFGTGVKCLLLEGCEIVLTSKYSQIFSIPVALIGLLFYTGIFILANLTDLYPNAKYTKLLLMGGVVGFGASIVFLYLQIFVIGALCIYCLTSFGTSTIIFISSTVLYKKGLGYPNQLLTQ